MKRFFLLFCLLYAWACALGPGCASPPSATDVDRGRPSTARSALTTYSSPSPGTGSFSTSVGAASPYGGVGQTMPVPAGDKILESFALAIDVVTGTTLKAFVAGWDATNLVTTGPTFECPAYTAVASGIQPVGCTANLDVGSVANVIVYLSFVHPGAPAHSGLFVANDASSFALGAGWMLASSGGTFSQPEAFGAPFSATFKAPIATTTTLGSSPSGAVFGQSVTFSATVAPATATGTVAFFEDGNALGTAALSGGTATLAPVTLPVGGHAITAQYAGDGTHLGSSAGPASYVVAKASTTVTLSSSPNPQTVGAVATFAGSVSATAPGAGAPSGTVTVFEDLTPVCSATLGAGGAYSCTSSALANGSHSLVARYAGDDDFAIGASSSYVHAVDLVTTLINVTTSPTTSSFGASVRLSATVSSGAGTPTGTVSFSATGIGVVSAPLAGGVAFVDVTALPVGTHTVTASYLGTSTFAGVTGTATHEVIPATTTTNVVSTTNPSKFGETFDLVASVTPAGATGQVVFIDEGSTIATLPLSGGSAVLTVGNFTVGTHRVFARYVGDASYATSLSGQLNQVVERAATKTTLAASGNPTVVGQPLSFIATVEAVAPGKGIPTGFVHFKSGAATLGVEALDATGVATFDASALGAGTRSIVAEYMMDTSWLGSTSAPLTHSVNQSGVAVTLVAAPNPSTYGTPVLLTATVASTSGGTPTGNVTFLEGTTVLGTGALGAAGTTTFEAAGLAGGPHTIAARYEGDAAHAGGATGSVAVTVNRAATTVTLASSVQSSVFGQPTTLTATVASAVAGSPLGTVTFSDGLVTIGTCAVAGGGCALVTGALATGSHSLTASYSGDASYAPATSTALAQTVERSDTSLELVSSTSPSLVDTVVTFTATVLPVAPGSGAPAGTVTFREGATTLGSRALGATGVATFETALLTAGAHTITAEYSGSADFAASSGTFVQQVNSSSAKITVTSSPNPSPFGVAVTFTAKVSGSAGTPVGQVTFREGLDVLGGPFDLDASGTASATTSRLGAGPRTITVSYGGDAIYATATGSTSHVVEKAATTTTVASSANPAASGSPITFTATVTSGIAGVTGQVEFFAGSTSLGEVALASAVASVTTTSLTAGNHAITATYRGTANFATSTSPPLAQAVGTGGADGGAATPGSSAPPPGAAPGNPDASVEGNGCACHAARTPWSGRSVAILASLGAAAALRRRRRAA